MRFTDKISSLAHAPWLAGLFAVFAGIAYTVQSWTYARILPTILDEGAYLVKGYLFATGQLRPYEEYGAWTNHMPLSFLIPGYVQAWFGPGIRTGRYFSIALGALMLVGLWLVVRRVAGKWWALAAVWAIALNIALIKAYSLAVSQVLAACILVWILVFALGKDRSRRELMAASVLAGVLAVTRVNLSPVLPFFLAYVLWQHGWKNTLWIAIPGGVVIALTFVSYWPGMIDYWSGYFSRVTSFSPALQQLAWQPQYSLWDRVNSLIFALRFNFIPLVSIATTWLLWPRKGKWADVTKFRIGVVLSGLFLFLLIIHTFNSVGGNSCVFCIGGYLSFFDSLALIVLAVSFPYLRRKIPKWMDLGIAILLLVLFIVVANTFLSTQPMQFVAPKDMHEFLRQKVPWFNSLGRLSGDVKLWILFQNKYGMDFQGVYNAFQRTLSSLIIGGVLWIVTLLGAILAMKIQRSKQWWRERSYGVYILMSLLIVGLLLSPTSFLGGAPIKYDCAQDIYSSHEAAGAILSREIPPGAQVFWDGGNSAVPLLYLPNAKIYTALINGVYSRVIGGDHDLLFLRGMWNDELSELWLTEADYLLINDAKYDSSFLSSGLWEQVAVTDPVVGCNERTVLHVLKKID